MLLRFRVGSGLTESLFSPFPSLLFSLSLSRTLYLYFSLFLRYSVLPHFAPSCITLLSLVSPFAPFFLRHSASESSHPPGRPFAAPSPSLSLPSRYPAKAGHVRACSAVHVHARTCVTRDTGRLRVYTRRIRSMSAPSPGEQRSNPPGP